jgi:hypothetical protein
VNFNNNNNKVKEEIKSKGRKEAPMALRFLNHGHKHHLSAQKKKKKLFLEK